MLLIQSPEDRASRSGSASMKTLENLPADIRLCTKSRLVTMSQRHHFDYGMMQQVGLTNSRY